MATKTKAFVTTLGEIRAARPCADGWEKLTAHLGPEWNHDKPLPYSKILEINGVDDACWALQYVGGDAGQMISRLFAADCAERVLHLFERERPEDKRPRQAIEAARSFARGVSSDAAWAAARAAARAAASDAARAAALEAASEAARAAARAAAWAAASDAASDAAWAAASDAEREWQTARLAQYLTLGVDGVPPLAEHMQTA